MTKTYKKSVAVVLAFLFIIFGLVGAFADEKADGDNKAKMEQKSEVKTGDADAKKPEEQASQKPEPEEKPGPMPRRPSRWSRLLQFIVNAIILGIVGILLLIIGYYIWELITVNYSVRDELVENKNTAVAIVTASFVIGMAIVIGIALTKI